MDQVLGRKICSGFEFENDNARSGGTLRWSLHTTQKLQRRDALLRLTAAGHAQVDRARLRRCAGQYLVKYPGIKSVMDMAGSEARRIGFALPLIQNRQLLAPDISVEADRVFEASMRAAAVPIKAAPKSRIASVTLCRPIFSSDATAHSAHSNSFEIIPSTSRRTDHRFGTEAPARPGCTAWIRGTQNGRDRLYRGEKPALPAEPRVDTHPSSGSDNMCASWLSPGTTCRTSLCVSSAVGDRRRTARSVTRSFTNEFWIECALPPSR